MSLIDQRSHTQYAHGAFHIPGMPIPHSMVMALPHTESCTRLKNGSLTIEDFRKHFEEFFGDSKDDVYAHEDGFRERCFPVVAVRLRGGTRWLRLQMVRHRWPARSRSACVESFHCWSTTPKALNAAASVESFLNLTLNLILRWLVPSMFLVAKHNAFCAFQDFVK